MNLKDILIYLTAFLVGLGLWKVSRDILYYVVLVKYRNSVTDKGTAATIIDFVAAFFGIGGVFVWCLLFL